MEPEIFVRESEIILEDHALQDLREQDETATLEEALFLSRLWDRSFLKPENHS